MNNGITRAFQMTALLLSVSLVTTSCHNSSNTREAESSLPLGVTPIVTNQNQSEPDSSIIENGNIADTTRALRIQDDWFDDSFFLLDNSSGYVNIYEIGVELPRSRSSQWAAEHSRAEVFDNINTGKWESDDNLTWAIGWFFGIPFSFELEAPPEHGIHPEDSDVTYWPPLDTVEKTTETIHSVSISSLPDGGELSFRELSGSENQDIQLACFELNNSALLKILSLDGIVILENGVEYRIIQFLEKMSLLGMSFCLKIILFCLMLLSKVIRRKAKYYLHKLSNISLLIINYILNYT